MNWQKFDRCWFWTRIRNSRRSYKQYATVIEVSEDKHSARVRTDAARTILRPTARLNKPEPR